MPWLVLVLLLALGGCGFQPLYSRSGPARGELAAIAVDQIPERSGQLLRTYLRDALNPNGETGRERYRLRVVLIEPRSELGLRRDDVTQRINYSVVASFRLTDGNDAQITAGTSFFSTSFEISSSPFATVSARQDARDRILELIAQDIRDQIATYFATRPR